MSSDDTKRILGTLLGVGVLAGLLILGTILASDPPSEDRGALAEISDPNSPPIAGGDQVTVGEAIGLLSVPFYRPETSIASDASIQDVWFVDDGRVYVRYKSGVRLKVEPLVDAPSNDDWAAALASDDIEGSIETVAGVDVFIVPQDPPSLGSARFFVHGVLVTFVGHGDFSVDDLKKLAESVITTADQAQSEKAAVSSA